jgi:hypothetical protein
MIGDKCEREGCDKPSVELACGREHRYDRGTYSGRWYCKEHADEAVDENNPEYETECPHCGCRFGVN